jgi:UDP-glucose 4-epimerase
VSRWRSTDPTFDLGNSDALAAWVDTLRGADVVIHLAARVHQLNTSHASDFAQARSINRDGTLRLARAALAAGVRRFVFVSTVKIHGEGEHGPYNRDSAANPQDAYAVSKWEAEQGLQQLLGETAMELVVIRPPLVYGAAASANFARLQRLARLPLPLPIKSIDNRRDMIGIDNLIDFISLCARAPAAAGGNWLCSDGVAYSLPEVVTTLRRALNMPSMLFPAPAQWVAHSAEIVLGTPAAQRLFGNFEVDIEASRALLHWTPPHSMLSILQASSAVVS